MGSIVLDAGITEGVVSLLGHLLETGRVDGVLTTRRIPGTSSFDLALITDAGNLSGAEPFAPVMTANAGQQLSSLSMSGKSIAAVLRPCELRAFVERVKREKGSFENLLTISPTCPGVYPLDRILEEGYDGLAASYFEAVSKGELPDGVRDSCRTCGFFVPIGSDITVSVAGCGDPGAGCTMYLNSARAAELTEGFGGDRTDREFDPVSLDGDLSARKSARRELFAGLDESCGSLDGLTDTFGRCVGCHGCSRVCPICYCLLCDFESSNFDYGFPYFEEHLSRKGALRLPPDTMLFHLGRLTHMSFSCVGCGMCSDVCPVDIPVATVFGRTGEVTRALFDYLPGRDPEEPVPVMIFREEELSELG